MEFFIALVAIRLNGKLQGEEIYPEISSQLSLLSIIHSHILYLGFEKGKTTFEDSK